MVKDHEKDVAAFRRMSQSAADPDLKEWATKTLPTLEDHLRQVRGIQAELKGWAEPSGPVDQARRPAGESVERPRRAGCGAVTR
jgi:Domain of unknown function (DUF4142)